MGIGLVFLFLLVFGLLGFGLWIWALVDAVQRSDADWEQAGQNKLVWVLILIFLGVIGALVYLVVARPRLEEIRRGF
jgi:heme/copper-type cytochrome/quinol oxidase subunit 2